MAPWEVQQMRRVRTREGVDRLGHIADDAHVVPLPQPQVQQSALDRRHVLELVDHEMPVLRAHLRRHVGTLLEHAAQDHEHVLEIDDPPLGLRVLVHVEEARHVIGAQTRGHLMAGLHPLGVMLRIDQ